MSHIPVLMDEVIRALSPQENEVIVDGTFGAGGYTSVILSAANCNVIGLDRDPNVAPHVASINKEYGKRFAFIETEFSKMDEALAKYMAENTADAKVDGVVLDIGVSSMQLDQGERGFSFMRSGPLDMRMSGKGVSAYDAIKHLEHNELIRIFKVYGEEKRARRCADFIVRAREKNDIETTEKLASIISDALGRSGKTHPATRTFQALRIFINDELGELHKGLVAAERILKPGGRLAVVSFHSMEDRIVKNFFKARTGYLTGGSRYMPPQAIDPNLPSFNQKKRSGISASKEELSRNPRSRSARLRVGVRTDAPVWSGDSQDDIAAFSNIPSLEVLKRRVS